MNPIYTTAIHQAACVNGVSGLGWLFWTQITIAVACMVMITLRAAWHDEPKNKKMEKQGKEELFFVEGSDENAAIPNDLDLAESGTSVDEAFVGKEH